jgi:hypothetical protein
MKPRGPLTRSQAFETCLCPLPHEFSPEFHIAFLRSFVILSSFASAHMRQKYYFSFLFSSLNFCAYFIVPRVLHAQPFSTFWSFQ